MGSLVSTKVYAPWNPKVVAEQLNRGFGGHNRDHLIKYNPIKDSYVANYPHVHSTNPCCHGVQIDRKLQTITNKAVRNYI